MSSDDGADPTTLHVRRALDGDRASLTWIVTRFTPLLEAQARYRLGPALARSVSVDDVVGDAWLVALQKMPEFDPGDRRSTPALLAWLARTVRFVANNALRAHLRGRSRIRQRPESEVDAVDALEARVAGIVSEAARGEESARIAEALAALDEDSRTLVILRGIEGLTNREIGELVGEKPNTVSHRYRRALDLLRARLATSVFAELVDE